MAGLENLMHLIYHEKQQEGSMLCAQYALNSLLLEGNYFTAPDLSDIARNLDALEESYDDSNTGNASTNMDDTGFFSVQVLENALKVWGLNLTRWRGEDMRPYQEHPHTQLAFILNLEQHWFTFRRFGHADPNLDNDHGDGHWFNLNSFLPEPEWVGKLYLGMVLQQAESDGYSVFAVTQADPTAPLALPRTVADEVAATLPDPRAARPDLERMSSSYTTRAVPPSSRDPSGRPINVEGLEDEDYDLQAAIQASMMGGEGSYDAYESPPIVPPPLTRAPVPLPSVSGIQSPVDTGSGAQTPTDGLPPLISPEVQTAPYDPVAASLERNKRMLEQMRAQQELAHREMWGGGAGGSDQAAFEARREERRRQEAEEAEQLRLAIEESEALAKQEGHNIPNREDNEGMDVDVVMPQLRPIDHSYSHLAPDRVYDDDDAELQAALKASLEQVPGGWELPELSHRNSVRPPETAGPINRSTITEKDAEDAESVLSDETSTTTDNPPSEVVEVVSMDELRKKRLARFGA
ncbi:Josephin-domain-containing protein [Collybia nuda]|uniref:ubiquitinyl hydrolase 1 n=1 Tax=Collybia nuda TaxID=64659 RepID=A0A9P5Y495_9AGAR|nr:Josephin-domain-containing protein [Collybia nuda]